MALFWIVCLIIGTWLGERKKRRTFAIIICLCLGPLGLVILSLFPTRLADRESVLPNRKALYEQVANEVAAAHVDKAAWARSIADSNGSSDVAKSLYIKYRVEHLASEIEEIRYARQRARIKEVLIGGGITIPILLGLAYLGSDRGQTHSSVSQSLSSPPGGFVGPLDKIVPSPYAAVTKTERKFDPNQPFTVESTPQSNPLEDLGGQVVSTPLPSPSTMRLDNFVPDPSSTPSVPFNTSSSVTERRSILLSRLSTRNEEVYKILKGLSVFQTDTQARQYAKQNHIVRQIITIETIRSVGGATHVTPEWWDEQIFNNTAYPVGARVAIRNAVNDCFQITRELNEMDNTGDWWKQDKAVNSSK